MITRSKLRMEKHDECQVKRVHNNNNRNAVYVEHIRSLHSATSVLLDDLDKLECEKLRHIISQYEDLIKNMLDIE